MSRTWGLSTEDIDNRFDYHRPTPEKVVIHEGIRSACGVLAHLLDEQLPPGREKATALTNLEQVMFWSNAAIARSN
ncbi:hypothetical protein CJ179_38305 [Rhodococcus sp. ACS1]|nr:hypothetical protein CJ179_38305 [Rhodococcus sp. ACS1]